MKKICLSIISVCFILFIALTTLSFVSSKSTNCDNETLQFIDQINPLVKEKESFVITKQKPDQLLEHNRVSYIQDSVDEKGNITPINFTAIEKLEPNRYLKISHKGKHVKTFEEVNEKQVPLNALRKLHHLS